MILSCAAGSQEKRQIRQTLFIKPSLLSWGGSELGADNHPTTARGQEFARFPERGGKQVCYSKRILQEKKKNLHLNNSEVHNK